MKRSNEIDNILDECLERLFAGESIEACLASYPEQAAELQPLLEMAAGTREAVDITPRSEFRQRAALEFQSAIRDMQTAKSRSFSLRFRPAWTSLLIVFVVIATLFSTNAVAASSMPDSPLYGVKTAYENARITLAFSPQAKAELYAQFADRRIDEIVAMAEAGKIAEINRVTDKLNHQLVAMAEVFGPDESDMLMTATSGERYEGAKNYEQYPLTAPAPDPADPTPTATMTQPPAGGEPDESIVTQESLGILSATEDKSSVTDDSVSGFREAVFNNSISNSMKLQDAMINAGDDPVREALERALAVATRAYTFAIQNIR